MTRDEKAALLAIRKLVLVYDHELRQEDVTRAAFNRVLHGLAMQIRPDVMPFAYRALQLAPMEAPNGD